VSSPSSCKKVLAESGLSANQPNDNFRSSSHPGGQTATESFSPSQNKSFLRRVLNKRSGNHEDPTATDGFGEGSNPKASTPSGFGEIPLPEIECPSLGPTENWKPCGPVKAAMKDSITASVSVAMIKHALTSGLRTDDLPSLVDQLEEHRQNLEEANETLKSLLVRPGERPTRPQYIEGVQEMSGTKDQNTRHGDIWDQSVGKGA
jgi:hypothetical protein